MPHSLLSERAELVATPALKFWRLSLGYPQSELAAESAVGESTIRRLEHGGRTTLGNVQRLTDSLQQRWDEDGGAIIWALTDYAAQDEPHTLDLRSPLTSEQGQFVRTS